MLDETHYAAWLLTQPRGEQRHANVQRLLALAQQFDQFQRQGLFRFLRFIEAQQAAETAPQVAAVSGEDSVQLMSIHQSKGLEFPVVVVADLGKPFNLSDLRAEIILDARYGLCPQIKPPHTGQRYPSLPYWLARQRQKQEMLGEELRLLYVAMTRARDLLILTGNVAEKKFLKQWSEPTNFTTASVLAARSYLDWIAAWSAQTGSSPAASAENSPAGENTWWRWRIYDDLDKRLLDAAQPTGGSARRTRRIRTQHCHLARTARTPRTWQYPHQSATEEPAKTLPSPLCAAGWINSETDGTPLFKFRTANQKTKLKKSSLSSAEIGTAHHTFLQFVSLEQAGTLIGLREEARRMELELILSAEEIAQLDFDALSAFWQSDIGKSIRAEAKNVRRELPFTARFLPAELPRNNAAELPDGEFVVVQGAADLVVVLPGEIWLVDFKTDDMTAAELPEKVKLYELQLRLYALALSRIYGRPINRVHLHFLALGHSERLQFQ